VTEGIKNWVNQGCEPGDCCGFGLGENFQKYMPGSTQFSASINPKTKNNRLYRINQKKDRNTYGPNFTQNREKMTLLYPI
jgi:hypothetical protein